MRILILFMCFISTHARAKCSLSDFARSHLFYSKPHINPSQKVLDEINAPYADFDFKIKPQRIEVYEKSIGAARPELVHALDDLDRYSIGFEEYVAHYKSLHKNKTPSSFEVRQFYQSRLNLFKYQTGQWANQLQKTSRPIADAVRKKAAEVQREFSETINHIKKDQRIADVEPGINAAMKKVAGISGEMRAIVSLPGVRHYSRTLGEVPELAEVIRTRIQRLKDEVAQDPERWITIQSHYDEIFGREVLENLIRKDKFGVLDNVERWILSKEIDIVRVEGNRLKWMEFKVNGRPFDLNDFPMTQIRQYSQIVEMLELHQIVDLQYLATGGMTEPLKAELNSMGVQVIR